MNKQNVSIGLAVVAIILAIIGLNYQVDPGLNGIGSTNVNSFSYSRPTSGEWTSYDNVLTGEFFSTGSSTVLGDFAIGSQGTKIDSANFGTCHLFTGADGALTTFSASTTINLDCQGTSPKVGSAPSALTGIVGTDQIFLAATTTLPTTGGRPNIQILSYAASSTAGYIRVTLANVSGADITLGTTTFQGWKYWAIR